MEIFFDANKDVGDTDQVFGCAAQGPGAVGDNLGEPKVRDLEVAVSVQQQILRLQVSGGVGGEGRVGEMGWSPVDY